LNLKRIIAVTSVLLSYILVASGAGDCQPMAKQVVLDFGGAFTQATVTKAQMGLVGVDLQTGKFITNNISVGIATGYDIVSFQKVAGVYERLAIVPIVAKAKYYMNIAPLMQLHASVGAGAYQSLPHLSVNPIGGVWDAELRPGGAIGIGFDYWFLGTKGLGGEIEYNFFDSGSSESSLFSYFAVRFNFSVIKL
jgi:hypothetical protein